MFVMRKYWLRRSKAALAPPRRQDTMDAASFPFSFSPGTLKHSRSRKDVSRPLGPP